MPLELPPRYEPVAPLGKGGGGEVWAARDRISGRTVALKALAEGATEREVEALVREAAALSGLEGLGVPRILGFGRLPGSARPYLVRELVEGRSLADVLEDKPKPAVCLEAIARAADQLTVLHRASLLHGDVKPGNIIVGAEGMATLVDLGLAAPWRELGSRARGLTPRYAAPELFLGQPLGVRAEVFALGATLDEVLEVVGDKLESRVRDALRTVAGRAMANDPSGRFPSADEMANELRRAAKLPRTERLPGMDASWPIVGMDDVAQKLMTRIAEIAPGEAIALSGPKGSGKSALLRRVAWTLGAQGTTATWIEAAGVADVRHALEIELGDPSHMDGIVILVDDAEELEDDARGWLSTAQRRGAKLVLVGERGALGRRGFDTESFPIAPLTERDASELVRRAIPSLSPPLLNHAIVRTDARPGRLRTLVRRLEGRTIVSATDIDRLLDGRAETTAMSIAPGALLERSGKLLDQGRFDEAAIVLEQMREQKGLAIGIARARVALGRGDVSTAFDELSAVEAEATAVGDGDLGRSYRLCAARAHLRKGDYARALELADHAMQGDASALVRSEALSVRGLAESYTGKQDAAEASLKKAIDLAKSQKNRRAESVALASLGLVLQRAERLGDARTTYEAALSAAEDAEDAGSIATVRLNLAALVQGQGDLADALAHLEAAVDMGRRSGRKSTVQQALLNLANLDLYLGRYARARASVETLLEQKKSMAAVAQAQLLGLQADLSARTGKTDPAREAYEACARAYDALGRSVDAAEARLEGVLLAARSPNADAAALAAEVETVATALGDAPAHRAMMSLARGSIAMLKGKEEDARQAFDAALAAARTEGQREWIWRTLAQKARLGFEAGQSVAARRDAEEALSVLEETAKRLPRDLREVFWDDARRRDLRTMLGMPATTSSPPPVRGRAPGARGPAGASAKIITTVAGPDADDRLTRIFEINRELAGEHDLARLLARVTDHAVALLAAERGFVILAEKGGKLAVQAQRDSDGAGDEHAKFSRGIAEKVIQSGEPIVSLSAREDARMAGFTSVHQLMLQSVACVPIRAPRGDAIGALYLETRVRPGPQFADHLPLLSTFADQAAVAIENARLVAESAKRAADLAEANRELETARAKLEENLGERTAQLDATRRDLRTTRAALRSHFGYHGLVGTSSAMRRVYALIDRVKETDIPVLLTGDSGTGKEMVARAIHQSGPRSKKPFTGVNCGAIPEHLLESELFGHTRGAFTGADRDRKGLFRETEGGTILLDEIGEMPKKMQAGLLRVLQEKVVRPVGGVKEEPVDVRIVAATNRDLAAMVGKGTFREDLYYRLHVVEVRLPSLRERMDDLPVLINHFLGLFAARFRREKKGLTRDALRKLMSYKWPGNVRQLENLLLNAWVMSEKSDIGPDDFDLPDSQRASEARLPPSRGVPSTRSSTSSKHGSPSSKRGSPSSKRGAPSSKRGSVSKHGASSSRHGRSASSHGSPSSHRKPPSSRGRSGAASSRGGTRTPPNQATRERDRILRALDACNGNRLKAAEMTGMPRRTFYRRLKEYGIQ